MRRLNRRTFLRSTGISLSLPMLQAMSTSSAKAKDDANDVRRMMAICAPLGIHTPYLFPKQSGQDYVAPIYLEPLQPVRDKFTIISGLMHPMVDGGHAAERSFLTGAAHPGLPSFKNSISVDQFAAEQIGHLTRVPSIALASSSRGISYTRSGVQVPTEQWMSRLFKRLFLEGKASEKEAQMRRIKSGQSIMDLVSDQAKSLGRKIGKEDNETLDQYFTSVREVEQRLVYAKDWAKKPKPKVEMETPVDITDRAEFTKKLKMIFDITALALQTDTTRLITLSGYGGNEVVKLKGVDDGWHNLSHHGKDPTKIEQLAIIELEEMRIFGEFLQKLDSIKEGDRSLLDQTSILMGSSLGNASAHNNINLPIIAAGGHFNHGQHLAFDPKSPPPLGNLLVSFLQHLQLDIDQFSTGTGTLRGLDSWA